MAMGRRSRRPGGTAVGHEERLPPSRLNGCCQFGQGTFAGTPGNGLDAPKADFPAIVASGPYLQAIAKQILGRTGGLFFAQHLPELAPKLVPRVRLRDQIDATPELSPMQSGVIGIAGGEQRGNSRYLLLRLAGQFRS